MRLSIAESGSHLLLGQDLLYTGPIFANGQHVRVFGPSRHQCLRTWQVGCVETGKFTIGARSRSAVDYALSRLTDCHTVGGISRPRCPLLVRDLPWWRRP